MDFPSQEIQRAWLLAASPETVYAWLEKRGDQIYHEASLHDETNSVQALMLDLANREERLIDLALARFGCNRPLLKRFWKTGDVALRHSIVTNEVSGPVSVFVDYSDNEGEEPVSFKEIEDSRDECLQKLFFTNPKLNASWLSAILERKSNFKNTPDKTWVRLAGYALLNPYVQSKLEQDRFASDPDLDTIYGIDPHESVYRLLSTIEPTVDNASAIANGVCGLKYLKIPYSEKSDESNDREEINRVNALEKLLERWTAERSGDVKSIDKYDGKEHFVYGLIREYISGAVPIYEADLRKFIINHSDRRVRMGFYRTERYKSKRILREHFEKDGLYFVEAGVDNVNLYERECKDVSDEFDTVLSLTRTSSHNEWSTLQGIRERRHKFRKQLFERDNNTYIDPNGI